MTDEHSPQSAALPPMTTVEYAERRTVSRHAHTPTAYRRTEIQLRETPVRDETLLHQKDAVTETQALLSMQTAHRLLNDLQTIVSVFPLQSPALANAEAAFAEHRSSGRL